jgi:eukaryotic-like serine/threonine-protein kinase
VTTPLTGPGRFIAGRYRLQSQIGGGGMGAVWTAHDELLGRQVALKQVLPPAGADPPEADQQRQRALREGRIAARLSHPHAISVYDVAVEAAQPWLVMEYLPSRSLAAVLAEDGLLRVDQVAHIGAQVADALAATHAAGIVHRDVKPSNVLIGHGDRVEGLVKITDFGISHASGDVTLTQTGQITGTPAFLAPEVAQGEEPAPPSDVFSLGATLYTCLEGQPPFGMCDNALQQLHRVASGGIDPPQRSGALTRPLLRMLAADPAARPTMGEVRDELAALVAGDGDITSVLMAPTDLRPTPPGLQRTATFDAPASAPPPPAGSTPAAGRDRPRRAGLWIPVAALLALAVLFGVVWLVTAGSGDSGATAQSPVPSTSVPPSSSSAAQPTSSSSAPTTTTPAPTTTTSPPPAAGQVSAKDVRDFLRQYHELVTRDPEQAWALTGPTLRGSVTEQGYVNFWSQYNEVKLSGVQAKDGSLTATGELEFRGRDGSRRREQHQFTLVRGADGNLLMDSDVQI